MNVLNCKTVEGSWKVKNGKFVRIRLTMSDKVESCLISGDFFLVPSESIVDLENSVCGLSCNSSREAFQKSFSNVLVGKDLLGVTAFDLSKYIIELLCDGE